MIKYKMAFTVPAEVLFGLLAKVLPIEDLSVEEVIERPAPAKPKQIERKKRTGNNNKGIQLNRGANGIILELFADNKPHRATELKPIFESRGLSANGVGSALEKLKKRGLVSQPEVGLWRKAG